MIMRIVTFLPVDLVRASLVLSGLVLAGCAGHAKSPAKSTGGADDQAAQPPSRTIAALNSNTDPCATRLHEAAGAMLLYFATHQDLPPTLEQLKKAPGIEGAGDMTCPVSHKPYVYNPAGIPTGEEGVVIVLFDPEPSHSGMRWAVTAAPPKGTAPMVAKVVAVPEARFLQLMATTRP